MAGDGTGVELTFRLAGPTTLTRVGMINGYAKNALVGGRKLNWYVGNRRVLSAQWVFDDGTTLDQPLGSTKQMQTIDLGAPVTTSIVTLRLVSVSPPGTGRCGPGLHGRQRGHPDRDPLGLTDRTISDQSPAPVPDPRIRSRRGGSRGSARYLSRT